MSSTVLRNIPAEMKTPFSCFWIPNLLTCGHRKKALRSMQFHCKSRRHPPPEKKKKFHPAETITFIKVPNKLTIAIPHPSSQIRCTMDEPRLGRGPRLFLPMEERRKMGEKKGLGRGVSKSVVPFKNPPPKVLRSAARVLKTTNLDFLCNERRRRD